MNEEDRPQSEEGCPDGATCHHRCASGCWRVLNDDPLPLAGYRYGQWPASTQRAYGTLVQSAPSSPLTTSSPAVPATRGPAPSDEPDELSQAPAAGEDPEPHGVPPIHEGPEEYAVRFVGPEGEGIPVIDLHALIGRLDGTVIELRAWSRVLDRYAKQAQKMADDLAHLRTTLNGET